MRHAAPNALVECDGLKDLEQKGRQLEERKEVDEVGAEVDACPAVTEKNYKLTGASHLDIGDKRSEDSGNHHMLDQVILSSTVHRIIRMYGLIAAMLE
ncbi:hypothetical protein NDU88_003922 [Pleurodeles waltl]|uniref:Uncharacterized protein n=1 Tax=Pleurodeles waltl TaxID=8319 RepID=A0AAV7NSB7_PLEWA|nr:hypothetical protein NDU88_003922 [Pleurodeles waltl]